MALKDLGVPASRTAMIGDDLDNDIAGAQAAGLAAILVKTEIPGGVGEKVKVKPDAVVEDCVS
jgi:ribonucleotide monophosphatase NagD (HAD superfamily)